MLLPLHIFHQQQDQGVTIGAYGTGSRTPRPGRGLYTDLLGQYGLFNITSTATHCPSVARLALPVAVGGNRPTPG